MDLALELVLQYRISYYDALIVATASLAGCAVVYSEDLSHGQTYGDVRVQNPFRES
ncbi:MAG: PIN domain-containing protein [Acidobacteriota bacterium]